MLDLRVRGLSAALALAAISCGAAAAGGADDPASRFVEDPAFRRAVLEESLAVRDNGYAQLRLVHYGRDWEALPEWNPEIATDAGVFSAVWDGALPAGPEAWLALGHDAFERWPAQRLPQPSAADGAVRVRYPDGSEQAALSCAGCHARRGQPGVASDLDLGALLNPEGIGWGPGRLDVTSDDRDDPVAIPDLRALRYERRLHWTGNLHNSVPALAVRIETLLITAANAAVRPPRAVAYALALYVDQLGAAAHAGPVPPLGAAVFARECSGCHEDATGAGDWVPVEIVGTDAQAALSEDRGSGGYRVPSLYGVVDRSRLTHEGRFASLEALFEPARAAEDHAHPFGLALSAQERTALLGYLRAL